MKNIEVRAALHHFIDLLKDPKSAGVHLQGEASSKVCHVAEKTLRAMETSEGLAKDSIVEITGSLKEFISENNSLWKHTSLKTFLLAIKELGVVFDSDLVLTFIHLQQQGADKKALSDFIKAFPQILNAQLEGGAGNTLLHYYADEPNLEMCHFLLDMGADLLIKNREGHTIFHRMACELETPDKMYALVTKEGVEELDFQENSALHLAVEHRNLLAIRAFFQTRPFIYSKNKRGFSLFHLAMLPYEYKTSRREVAEFLSEQGVPFLVYDEEGNNPLHFAAMFGEVEDLNFFKDYAILLNVENQLGQTPLDLFVKREEMHPPDFLLKEKISTSSELVAKAFQIAVKDCKWDLIKYMLEHQKIDLKTGGIEVSNLLQKALKDNQHQIVSLILKMIRQGELPLTIFSSSKHLFTSFEMRSRFLLHALETKNESAIEDYIFLIPLDELLVDVLERSFLNQLLEKKMFSALRITIEIIGEDKEHQGQKEAVSISLYSLINQVSLSKDKEQLERFFNDVALPLFLTLKEICKGSDLISPLLIREKKFQEILTLCECNALTYNADIQGRSLLSYAIEFQAAALCNFLIKKAVTSLKSFQEKIDGKFIIDLLFEFKFKESLTFLIEHLASLLRSHKSAALGLLPIFEKLVTRSIELQMWEVFKSAVEKLNVDCGAIEYKGIHLTSYLLNEKQFELASFLIRERDGEVELSEVSILEVFENVIEAKNKFLIHHLLDYIDELPLNIKGRPLEQCFVDAGAWGALTYLIVKMKIEKVDVDEKAVILASAQEGYFDCAQLFISRGAPFQDIRVQGVPLLHFAIQNRSWELVDALITKKADLNEKDDFGRSPLYYAFQNFETEFWISLMESGAKLSVMDLNFSLPIAENFKVLKLYLSQKENESFEFEDQLAQFLIPKRAQVDIEEALGLTILEQKNNITELLKLAGSLRLKQEDVILAVAYPKSDSRDPSQRFNEAALEIENAFNELLDQDLEGVLGIDEKVLSPEEQRENFARYIRICREREVITGVLSDKRDQVYEPMRNAIEHMAKAWPLIREDEKLSLLTNFSRIGKTYCIDPYRKASLWAFNIVQMHSVEGGGEEMSVSTGSEIDHFRNDLLKASLDWSVLQMQQILGEADGTTDTHAINWAYKHFGPQVGLKISKLEEGDIHLGWGKVQLGRFLLSLEEFERFDEEREERQDEILIEKLKDLFWSHFRGHSFQHFFKSIQHAFQKSSSATLDYYYSLVDAQKAEKMSKAKAQVKNLSQLEQYLAVRSKLKKTMKSLQSLKRSIRGCDEQLRTLKSQEARENLVRKKEDLQSSIDKIEQKFDEETHIDVLSSEVQSLDLLEKSMQRLARGQEKRFEACSLIIEQAERKKEEFSERYIDLMEEEPFSSYITLEGVFEFYKMFIKYERTRG